MRKCKYGKRCNDRACTYLHPGGNNNQRSPTNRSGNGGNGGRGNKYNKANKYQNTTCYKCGKKGNTSSDCYSRYDINKKPIENGTWKFKPCISMTLAYYQTMEKIT